MATQYTDILKLALPTQGELAGSWGDTVNNEITTLVEEAVAGQATINTWTTNTNTLGIAEGATATSRAAILKLTDTGSELTGNATVICPANPKIYLVDNQTGRTATIKTASGTGQVVPTGETSVVFCDGVNVKRTISYIPYDNATSGLTATDVQGAIDEVDAKADVNAGGINTLDGRVTTNTNNINTNTSDISGLTGDLSALNGEVDTNTNLLATRGTAFDADVQTSALDATAGRLLTVGAFGLGFIDGVNYPQTSLDNADGVETGFYRAIGATTNKPTSVIGVVIHQVYFAAAAQFTQRFIGVDGSSFSRGSSGGTASNPTWTSWTETPTVASLNLKADIADPNFTGQVRIPTGTAALPALRTSGDSNTGLFFPASDTVAFATGASERMRINASGDVGIGTSSPSFGDGGGLEIQRAGTATLRLENTVDNSLEIRARSNSTDFIGFGAFPMRFFTGGTERMRITDAGNVGIGTSNPDARLNIANGSSGATPDTNYDDLHVESSASAGITISSATNSVAGIAFGDEDDSFAGGILYPNFDDSLRFLANGSERMRIDASGNVGIGTSSPSAKLDVNGDAIINSVTVGLGAGSSSGNTAIGLNVLSNNTAGDFNTAVGRDALFSNTTGQTNTANGVSALRSNTTGIANTAYGVSALRENITGNKNTAFGNGAGRLITAGDNNTILGSFDGNQGGLDIRTSSNNIVISAGDGNPRIVSNASGNVGIGTISPSDKLDIAGSIRFSGSALMSGNAQYIRATDSGSATPRILGLNATNDFFIGPIDTYAGGSIFYGASANVQKQIFDTGGTERMRIDESGNIGIGTNSPSRRLDVVGEIGCDDITLGTSSINSAINFTSTDSARAKLEYSNTTGRITLSNSFGGFVVATGTGGSSSERMRVLSTGDVGIGTPNPSAKLEVNGSLKATSMTIGTKEVGYNQVDVATQNTTNTNFGASNGYYTKTTNSAINLTIASSLPVGGVITLSNTGTGAATIIPTSGDTLNWFGGAGVVTGNRALAQGGMCTIVRRSASLIDITGSGLS